MSYQYDQYLNNHRENVKKAFHWIQDNLPDLLVGESDSELKAIMDSHDQSKSEIDEYQPYDTYFYCNNRSFQGLREYRKAWLLHIHRNPHHWQHWVLINDGPNEGEIILEMPNRYILEMICDWWSFSWSKSDLQEVFNWYDEHKDYMKLHPNTKEQVEYILRRIKEGLEEEVSNVCKKLLRPVEY